MEHLKLLLLAYCKRYFSLTAQIAIFPSVIAYNLDILFIQFDNK